MFIDPNTVEIIVEVFGILVFWGILIAILGWQERGSCRKKYKDDLELFCLLLNHEVHDLKEQISELSELSESSELSDDLEDDEKSTKVDKTSKSEITETIKYIPYIYKRTWFKDD